jgi:hypothetical protein
MREFLIGCGWANDDRPVETQRLADLKADQ